jgi:hypothetical protein
MAMAEAKTEKPVVSAKTAVFNPFMFARGLLFDSGNRFNLKLLNAFLLACVAVLAIRFVYVIRVSYEKMQTGNFQINADSPGEIKEKTILKKLEYYLAKVKKRDIFRMGMAARPENMIEAAPSSKAVEATQRLKLVGISWSDDPDAMLEDTKASKTFFVKKGQSIGDVKVENITKDKIVLRLGDELVDLR